MSADFTSEVDRDLLRQTTSAPEQVKQYVNNFMTALKDDRKSIFIGSLFRSLLFIAAAAFMVWLAVRNKISRTVLFAVVGLLAFVDLMSVDTQYLNSEKYQDAIDNDNSFVATQADQQILADTSYYRVFDLRQGLGTLTYGAGTANFHKSIGGYHPAKLSIYQDLIEHQLSKFPQSLPVVNMLNTKYIIQADQQGKEQVFTNPDASGPAWFVKNVRFEATPLAVMNALSTFNPKDTAIVLETERSLVTAPAATDSAQSIQLVKNDNDEVFYTSNSASGGFAVFSEVYYNKGWTAYIDGKEAPIVRTNYVLRGLSVPAGQHQIRFVFHPSSYYTGNTIALIAGMLVFLALIVAAYLEFRKRKAIRA
jgi:hypothetical protein